VPGSEQVARAKNHVTLQQRHEIINSESRLGDPTSVILVLHGAAPHSNPPSLLTAPSSHYAPHPSLPDPRPIFQARCQYRIWLSPSSQLRLHPYRSCWHHVPHTSEQNAFGSSYLPVTYKIPPNCYSTPCQAPNMTNIIAIAFSLCASPPHPQTALPSSKNNTTYIQLNSRIHITTLLLLHLLSPQASPPIQPFIHP